MYFSLFLHILDTVVPSKPALLDSVDGFQEKGHGFE